MTGKSSTTRRARDDSGWQAHKSAMTREAILDAAVRCFIDIGYGGTTTARIAEAAGLSRGAEDRDSAVFITNAIFWRPPGNRVPTHRDVDGDTQLLLCLQGLPQPERGGDLVVEGQPVPLSSGDAVLFAASRLRHGTRRIEGSQLSASGFSRVVLVLRLFAGPRDGGEGASPQRLESG